MFNVLGRAGVGPSRSDYLLRSTSSCKLYNYIMDSDGGTKVSLLVAEVQSCAERSSEAARVSPRHP